MGSSLSASPSIYQIQPLEDPRWTSFLERHPLASAFHAPAWLEALRRTYGYQPVAFTLSAPETPLASGLVACRVDSWLTGSRLVSVPFADHCEPLLQDPAELQLYAGLFERLLAAEKWRYVELRPAHPLASSAGLRPSGTYCFHELDLRPDINTLFRNLHRQSTQRKVQRARREGLIYEEGRSEYHLDQFYRMQILTRRRHDLPPQPKSWFRNLAAGFGEWLKIRIALKQRQAVASILTIRHKQTMLYKYGCSDPRFHNLGGMHLLLWETIEEAKKAGLRCLDLGRSDREDAGLITFKDRWGATRRELTYYRHYPPGAQLQPPAAGQLPRLASAILPHLPNRVLETAGTFLYRHMG